MVARAGKQLTVTHQVQARIAAMDPGGAVALHHRRHQGGALGVEHAFVAGITDDLVVGRQQRGGQKVGHSLHHGLGLALEQCRHGLQRHLRRHFAFGVAAHAVSQHKQAGLAGVAVAHAVFVARTTAPPTDLEDGKFHLVLTPVACGSTFFLASDTRVSNWRRTFSPTDSLV